MRERRVKCLLRLLDQFRGLVTKLRCGLPVDEGRPWYPLPQAPTTETRLPVP